MPPAYLYAKTAGHVQFDRKVAGLMGTMSSVGNPSYTDAYPKSSIISASHSLYDNLATALTNIATVGPMETSYHELM